MPCLTNYFAKEGWKAICLKQAMRSCDTEDKKQIETVGHSWLSDGNFSRQAHIIADSWREHVPYAVAEND
eukprot:66394-Amphidinium_carterae.1